MWLDHVSWNVDYLTVLGVTEKQLSSECGSGWRPFYHLVWEEERDLLERKYASDPEECRAYIAKKLREGKD